MPFSSKCYSFNREKQRKNLLRYSPFHGLHLFSHIFSMEILSFVPLSIREMDHQGSLSLTSKGCKKKKKPGGWQYLT
jgi:hypothetical protein